MKEIKMSNGKVMLVDDGDYNLMSRFHWSWFKSRNTYYAQADVGGKCRILAHRLLLGARLGELTDHIDGNGLNNQRSNTRLCSRSQNCQNTKRRIDNSSGYRGVHRLAKGFVARIRVDGKRHYLGYFIMAIDAARAYDLAAKKYHGDYASLNFKEGK